MTRPFGARPIGGVNNFQLHAHPRRTVVTCEGPSTARHPSRAMSAAPPHQPHCRKCGHQHFGQHTGNDLCPRHYARNMYETWRQTGPRSQHRRDTTILRDIKARHYDGNCDEGPPPAQRQ